MKALKHLNKYFLKYKRHLILGLFFVIGQTVLAIYSVQILGHSLDSVITMMKDLESGVANYGQSEIRKKVFTFLVLIISVALARGLVMFMMRQTIIVMSRLVEYDLKNEIYNQYQRLSLAFYRRNNTGDLMNRISEDVGRVRMYVGPAIMYTSTLAGLLVGVTFIMFTINTKMAFYVLAPLPLLSISIYYVSDLMNKKSEEVQRQQSRLSTFVQETFSGIRILKSFVKENSVSDEFSKESELYLKKNMSLVKVNAFFFPLMLLLVGISTLLVVYIGGQEVIAGRATFGNIAQFIIYVNMLTWPVAMLGWVTSIIQRAAASQERINEFLHLEPEIISGNNEPIEISGKIEFRNVSFVYPDSGIKALEDVSFTVTPGKSLAILGKTGSGKSTIANLLLRMYDTTSGNILVDDTDIKNVSLTSLRKQTGYVPQDVFLFSDSIGNNIAFGLTDQVDSKAKTELIYTAAKQAVIYDNIDEFPKKFETMIGERGITLSGGQKQRLSIARAIIKQPKILIFDDSLSAVDTGTERKILDNLELIMKGKTSLIISHRISSVKHANEIIFLDGGRIIERGNHISLMENDGEYAHLFDKQMLEEEHI